MKYFFAIIYFLLPLLVQAQKFSVVRKKEGHLVPATVQDFKTERLSSSNVLVTWHTGLILNGNGFELERKLGLNGDFTSLGSFPLKKAGNNSDIMDYQFNDANNYSGTSYYRLKQKDGKGNIYYSIALKVPGIDKR